MMRRQLCFALLALSTTLFSQDLPKSAIPIERYFQYPILNGRSPAAPAMSPDGKHIVFGWNETGERKLDLWIMDYPSGNKRRIADAGKFLPFPRQEDTRTEEQRENEKLYDGGIGGCTWSPDSKEFIFSYKGRAWVCDSTGKYRPIFDAPEPIGSPSYSPDGKYIGFLRDDNVFRYDRVTHDIKKLTFIAKSGTSIEGFLWSPDSKNIAVSWADSSKLGNHVMMDFTKDRATVVPIKRMWNGDKSQDAQVGIVGAEGGIIKWVTGIPHYMWTSALEWSPDGTFLLVGWFKDDFQEWTLSVVPATTMKTAQAYKEKAPKNYIPDFRNAFWSKDSKKIYFTTDILDGQFGFRSLMSVSPNGQGLAKVYSENHDIAAAMRPKDSDRLILVTMGRSPLQTELTFIEPDGKRKVVVPIETGFATPSAFDDAGLPLVSDDGTKIASMVNGPTMNGELFSIEPEVRRLTKSQRPEFDQIKWADCQEVTFKAADGATIHGVLFTKPGLDKTKVHPAFISNIYANSAKQSWSGYFENYAAMELGFVVLKVDFRASWGYGGEFNSGYFKQMGLIDADEAVAAKNYLVSLGYVNSGKVGIWGWSYGGYLTCMTLLTKPGVFNTGVAVASVTDWKSYNEWYTRRRLGLADDEKDLFKKTSPINYPEGLQDNLLLVHGLLDDNVLFQDSARLMQKLIEKGKYFDLMTYPQDDHSIGKNWSRPHVFGKVMRYLWQKLGG